MIMTKTKLINHSKIFATKLEENNDTGRNREIKKYISKKTLDRNTQEQDNNSSVPKVSHY